MASAWRRACAVRPSASWLGDAGGFFAADDAFAVAFNEGACILPEVGGNNREQECRGQGDSREIHCCSHSQSHWEGEESGPCDSVFDWGESRPPI